ncbi:hypothetical protein GCM10008909_05990 [Hathewaya limosa]
MDKLVITLEKYNLLMKVLILSFICISFLYADGIPRKIIIFFLLNITLYKVHCLIFYDICFL